MTISRRKLIQGIALSAAATAAPVTSLDLMLAMPSPCID